jgi:hypothetical protein
MRALFRLFVVLAAVLFIAGPAAQSHGHAGQNEVKAALFVSALGTDPAPTLPGDDTPGMDSAVPQHLVSAPRTPAQGLPVPARRVPVAGATPQRAQPRAPPALAA